MDSSLTWVGLRLDPLDTLFFRDGRPFDAANRVVGGLPTPQTLAGAIRTALLARTGFDFATFARLRRDDANNLRGALHKSGAKPSIVDARFRGPWLAHADDEKGITGPLFPMPETLKRAKAGGWSAAEPTQTVPGWEFQNGLHPLWRTIEADPKADAELLTLTGLTKFLADEAIPDAECVKRDTLTAADHRIGIEINKDTLTSADGQLYAISLLATRPRQKGQPAVCLYAEVELTAELRTVLNDVLVPFGGEGKYVRVTVLPGQTWPGHDARATHSMWYLATPTFFAPNGPPLPQRAGRLIAAASGAGVPVSGWDVARNGPRPTRFAVPAGAIYFVEGPASPDLFLDTGNEIESNDLRQEGWGFALPGHWEGLK